MYSFVFTSSLDCIFQLPDVTHALRNITQLMEDNIVYEVSQGRDSFLRIQKDIQQAVNQTIPVVSASIRRAGDSLEAAARNMTALLDMIILNITNSYIPSLDVARNHIDQYAPYRYVKIKYYYFLHFRRQFF